MSNPANDYVKDFVHVSEAKIASLSKYLSEAAVAAQ